MEEPFYLVAYLIGLEVIFILDAPQCGDDVWGELVGWGRHEGLVFSMKLIVGTFCGIVHA